MEKCLTIPIFGFVLCWIFNSCCKEEIEVDIPTHIKNTWHCAFVSMKKNKLEKRKNSSKPSWGQY